MVSNRNEIKIIDCAWLLSVSIEFRNFNEAHCYQMSRDFRVDEKLMLYIAHDAVLGCLILT